MSEIRSEYGVNREAEMTEPRPLPNNCKTAISEAAEHVAAARLKLKRMVVTAPYEELSITRAILDLTEALRWLESIGSQTRPEQL